VGVVRGTTCRRCISGESQAVELLFGLSDIFADHLAQVDALEVETQLFGKYLGGNRLTRSAYPGEERADAKSACPFIGKPPRLIDGSALLYMNGNIPQHLALCLRQNKIVPGGSRFEPLSEVIQARASLHPVAIPQQHMKSTAGNLLG